MGPAMKQIFEKRMEDSPLDRLQPIVDVRDRTILDDVGCVLEKVGIEQSIDECHQIRFSMMKSRRSGVFFPM